MFKTITFVLAIILAITGCNKKTPILTGTDLQITELTENEVILPEQTPVSSIENENLQQNNFTETIFDRLGPITEIEMILVQGGKMLIQGHDITLDSFYMSKYVLTNGIHEELSRWALENGYNQYTGYGGNGLGEFRENYYFDNEENDNIVVVQPWATAIAICNYLSLKEGLTPVYLIKDKSRPVLHFNDIFNIDYELPSGMPYLTYNAFYIDWNANGYRLPTEAEWEFAAKGGSNSMGYLFAGSNTLENVSFSRNDETWSRYIVGQKKPNELGLHDMSNTASEWCFDQWEDSPLMTPSHNPGRIETQNFENIDTGVSPQNPFYIVMKGGNRAFSNDFYRPNARLRGYPFFGTNDYDDHVLVRDIYQSTIRLVRKY